MNKNQIDVLLRRNISKGTQFDQYIDKKDNTKQSLGVGDTLHGVRKMREWVLRFYPQVSRLTNFFKGNTLRATCENIKHFLYHNIQYSMDKKLQQLRSPANSWENRFTGIDCKSYSVFASCILTNLGLKHYIRRIQQAHLNKGKFSHVYVIVPINQETGSLESGYFTIDGTVKGEKEPNFTIKDDLLMDDKLQYVGLNGAAKKPTKKAPAKKPIKKAVAKKPASKSTSRKFPFT